MPEFPGGPGDGAALATVAWNEFNCCFQIITSVCMDGVVHFEIPAEDTERAKRFYSSIFGWQLQQLGPEFGNYIMAVTTEVDKSTMRPKSPGMINGGMMKRNDKVKAPVVYMYVDDIGATLKKVEEQGGSVVQGKTQVQGDFYTAYFKDCEGNVMGLAQGMM